MDKDKIKEIRKDMDAALRVIGSKHSLAFEIGRITYSDNGFGARVEAVMTSNSGESKMAIDFRDKCGKYGFVPEDLGKMFKDSSGNNYRIIGLKPRNRKYPIIAEKLNNGKSFKFSALYVKAMI